MKKFSYLVLTAILFVAAQDSYAQTVSFTAEVYGRYRYKDPSATTANIFNHYTMQVDSPISYDSSLEVKVGLQLADVLAGRGLDSYEDILNIRANPANLATVTQWKVLQPNGAVKQRAVPYSPYLVDCKTDAMSSYYNHNQGVLAAFYNLAVGAQPLQSWCYGGTSLEISYYLNSSPSGVRKIVVPIKLQGR